MACLIAGCSYGSIHVVDLRSDGATPEDAATQGAGKDAAIDAGRDAHADAEAVDAASDASDAATGPDDAATDADMETDAAAADAGADAASDAGPMGVVVEPSFLGAEYFNEGNRSDAVGEPCDAQKDWSMCTHTGQQRSFVVADRSTCTGLSATDAHGWYDWSCAVKGGQVVFYTDGLRDHVRLQDLIDVAAAAWRSNVVTVLDGADPILATVSAPFWSDAIEVVAPSTAAVVKELDQPYTVYLIRASGQYPGLRIVSDHVSLVIADGVEIFGGPAGEPLLEATEREHLWIEAGTGALLNTRGHAGSAIYLDVRFSEIRGLRTQNEPGASNAAFDIKINAVASRVADLTSISATGVGILLEGRNSLAENLKAEEAAGTCITVALAASRVSGMRAVACGDRGVYVVDADDLFGSAWFVATTVGDGVQMAHVTHSAFDDMIVANAGARGVALTVSESAQASANVTLSRVNVFGSVSGGILLTGSDHRVIRAVTAGNDGDGVRVEGASAVLLHLTSVMNSASGVHVTSGAQDTSIANVVSAANDVGQRTSGSAARTHVRDLFAADNGVDIDVATDDNTFAGVIDVTATDSCVVSPGLSGAGIADPCASQDGSTAIFVAPRTTVGAFAGQVTGADPVNSDDRDGLGKLSYDAIQDWSWGEPQRNWGRDGTYATAAVRGRCATGQVCVPWDHRVFAAGSLGDVNAATEGELSKSEHVRVHTWTPKTQGDCSRIPQAQWNAAGSVCSTTFLDHSFLDVFGTGQDGLCTNGEMCVLARNRGAYAGRGDVVTLFSVVNVPGFGWFKARWLEDNGL